MWNHQFDEKGEMHIFTLEKTVAGIENAKLHLHLKESTYSAGFSTIHFSLNPLMLLLKTELDGVSYKLNIKMYDEKEIIEMTYDGLAELMNVVLEAYDRPSWELEYLQNNVQSDPKLKSRLQECKRVEKERRKELENTEWFSSIENLIVHPSTPIQPYEKIGYVEINCQRGYRGSKKSQEVGANAPLMPNERAQIVPLLFELAKTFPDIPKPARETEYYQFLIQML